MAEGDNEKNVIRPQFGKKPGLRIVSSQPELPPVVPQSNDDKNKKYAEFLFKDLLYRRANMVRVKEALKKCDEATTFIFDVIHYRKNDESVALRQGAIGSMSVESMCDAVLDSTKSQWAQKPAYWGAILLELDLRMTLINEVEATLPKTPKE